METNLVNMPQQSPINLTDSWKVDFGRRGLSIRWKKTASGIVKPDVHGGHVEFTPDDGNYITLGGKKFYLLQLHLHAESEHWVDGKQLPMEVHLVHQSIDDDAKAVLGAFIEPCKTSTCQFGMADMLKSAYGEARQDSEPLVSGDPRDWIPDDHETYHRYEGSLTTPEYDETVSWAVFENHVKIPRTKFNWLAKHFCHGPRLPQPLHRRFLLSNF